MVSLSEVHRSSPFQHSLMQTCIQSYIYLYIQNKIYFKNKHILHKGMSPERLMTLRVCFSLPIKVLALRHELPPTVFCLNKKAQALRYGCLELPLILPGK